MVLKLTVSRLVISLEYTTNIETCAHLYAVVLFFKLANSILHTHYMKFHLSLKFKYSNLVPAQKIFEALRDIW